MKYQEIPIIHNEANHRFELTVNEYLSFIDYKKKGNTVYLIHTEVPPQLEGHGVAATMVEKTFGYLESHHLKLVAACTYVQLFLKRHPEWNRLL